MQTSLICLCLCLLSTALATPAFNKKIVGFGYFLLHQIILKGCNAKHGFYIFKYVYSFSTRRNQTQIK
ncbi:OC116 protein, partial [Machaerirhynchus nigripectus]|nr:OC116 protein [Machaerirhynchus nigripectus]